MSTVLEDVVNLYEAYLNEFHRLKQVRRPLEGAFGLGSGPQDYPCHEKFVEDLDELLKRLTEQSISSGQAQDILNYIYFIAPACWETETAIYWVLLAVQGSTVGLIERLDELPARSLCDEYQRFYPRYQRLPLQNRVLDALHRRGTD